MNRKRMTETNEVRSEVIGGKRKVREWKQDVYKPAPAWL